MTTPSYVREDGERRPILGGVTTPTTRVRNARFVKDDTERQGGRWRRPILGGVTTPATRVRNARFVEETTMRVGRKW